MPSKFVGDESEAELWSAAMAAEEPPLTDDERARIEKGIERAKSDGNQDQAKRLARLLDAPAVARRALRFADKLKRLEGQQ